MDEPEADAPEAPRGPAPRVFAATLYCEMCDRTTPHRILRMDPVRKSGPRLVQGTARCRVCQWTHRFESRPPGRVGVARIVSDGKISVRSRVELPAHLHVQVGSGIPGSDEPFRVLRIDTRDGHRVRSALTEEIATLWAVRDAGAVVPVSIVEGRFTRNGSSGGSEGDRVRGGRALHGGRDPPSDRRAPGPGKDLASAGRSVPGPRGEPALRPSDRYSACGEERLEQRTGDPEFADEFLLPVRTLPFRPRVSRNRMVPRRRTDSGGAAVHRLSPS